MPTQAILGYQTFLQRGDGGAPETFTNLIEILKIEGPDQSRDIKDATNMGSTSSTKENIPGLIDSGTVVLQCSWVPGNAQHAGIYTDFINGTLRNFKIVLPATVGKSWGPFTAFVSKYKPAYPVDDKMVIDFTLDISGPVASPA